MTLRYNVLALLAFLVILIVAAPCAASSGQLSDRPAERAAAVSAISIDAPATVTAKEGTSISITANIGSGDPHSLINVQVHGQPPGLNLSLAGYLPWSATLSGTLGYETAGTWTISWVIRDQFGAYDSTATQLVVQDSVAGDLNLPPIAQAGGPYTGLVGSQVTLDGSASSDPNGDALSYTWDFGDGGYATGAQPSHTYTSTGTFNVRLTVSDGSLVDEDQTAVVVVAQAFRANIVLSGGDRVLQLDAGKPLFCVGVEPERGPFGFVVVHVNLSSFEMVYKGSRISAIPEKTAIDRDTNQNGIQEISACFAKEDLRQLFADLPVGTNQVEVTISARHVAGNPISGTALLTVVVKRGLAVTSAPNPMRPAGAISFTTSRPGSVRVQIFDVRGRLVRTLVNSEFVGSGTHAVAFNGRDGSGRRLGSGIYFARVHSASDGSARATLVLAR